MPIGIYCSVSEYHASVLSFRFIILYFSNTDTCKNYLSRMHKALKIKHMSCKLSVFWGSEYWASLILHPNAECLSGTQIKTFRANREGDLNTGQSVLGTMNYGGDRNTGCLSGTRMLHHSENKNNNKYFATSNAAKASVTVEIKYVPCKLSFSWESEYWASVKQKTWTCCLMVLDFLPNFEGDLNTGRLVFGTFSIYLYHGNLNTGKKQITNAKYSVHNKNKYLSKGEPNNGCLSGIRIPHLKAAKAQKTKKSLPIYVTPVTVHICYGQKTNNNE